MISETNRSRLSGAFFRVVAPFHRRDATAEEPASDYDEATPDEEWVDDDWDEGRRRARIITVSLVVALVAGGLISVWLGSPPLSVVLWPNETPQARIPIPVDPASPVETIDPTKSTAVESETRAATPQAATREIPTSDAGARGGPVPQATPRTDSLPKESAGITATRQPTAVDAPPGQPKAPAAASTVRPRPPEATVHPTPDTRRSATASEPSRATGPSRDADRLDGGDIIDWLVKEAPHRR
jgi:hypothetical protein